MSQTYSEITKEIVIAAIQGNVFSPTRAGMSVSAEQANKINVEELSKFYNSVYDAVKAAEN